MENGQALHNSPYVEQIDKFAASLKQLSETFLKLEEKKQTFSEEEITGMFDRVREKVCDGVKIIFICTRWAMRYLQPLTSMEMN